MSEIKLIHCPGCDAVVDASRPCCPGCGRCLGCGDRRARGEEICPQCKVPYCTHCGKCLICNTIRYTGIVDPASIVAIRQIIPDWKSWYVGHALPPSGARPWWSFW